MHNPICKVRPQNSLHLVQTEILELVLMRKESLGYSAQRSFEGSSSLKFISSGDVDFNDVFGGPPRRYSLHETTRYSSDGGEQTASRFRSLSSENPVFGERSVCRRKHESNDFFDDIFPGVKPDSGFGSMRQNETFGTSLPSQFSLLSTASTKVVDYHRFASSSTSESKEDASDGISSPDATGLTGDPKRDSNETEATTDINHYHFPIYKWAGREVPLVIPARQGSDSKSDNYMPRRWSSSDGKMRSDKNGELLPANAHNIDIPRRSARVSKKIDKTSILERTEKCNTIEGVLDSKQEIIEAAKVSATNLSDRTSFSNKSDEAKPTYLHETSMPYKTKKEVSAVAEESPKPSLKSSHWFLNTDVEGQEREKIDMTIERKGNVGTTKNVKKCDGKISNSTRTEVNKSSTEGSQEIPGGNLRRSGVRGKVKGFIRIFNKETYSKPKSNLGYQNQSSRWEAKVTCGEFNESNHSISKPGTSMHFHNLNMELDVSAELDDNAEQPEKHHLQKTSTFHSSSDYSSHLETFPCSESILDDSEVKSDMTDDPFQDNYLVELPQTSEEDQANKDLDVKIFKWSNGKEGNIRSLLSTLQYVLWAESGWKAVPLVNIIELNEVKRAYQKALLCLHPDKLQQKGADSDQKYIAEKVFAILQEAWNHSNSIDIL